MLSLTLAIVTAATTTWVAWRFWASISPAKSLTGIPLVEFDGDNSRERYAKDVATLLKEGYAKHIKHGEPFCVRDFLNPDRPRVYLPLKYMEEVRNADQKMLSLPAVLDNTSTMSKVGGPRITDEIQISARVDLNRALNDLIEPMQIRCFRAAAEDLPACQEWTPLVLYPKILNLFSQMSARVMVGPELCDSWPAISMKYITRVLAAQGAIRSKYHPLLYWTAYYLSPEVALVNQAAREAADLVAPVLKARKADTAQRHNDFLQWVMDHYHANGKAIAPEEAVQNIFIVMFASMHGTSFIALQSLFSIVGTPGALAKVREELSQVKDQELKGSSVWTRSSLGKLRTLDSFMKESLRLKPFQEATVQRVAMTPYVFKDGLRVPAGTVLSFPNLNYNNDSDALPPDASTFDGERWLRRRREEFDASKFQFASTAENAFDWGAGPHACPGRFMADITIKLMLISLISKYDMKLEEGGLERPMDKMRFTDRSPDTSMPIMVRDVSQ